MTPEPVSVLDAMNIHGNIVDLVKIRDEISAVEPNADTRVMIGYLERKIAELRAMAEKYKDTMIVAGPSKA